MVVVVVVVSLSLKVNKLNFLAVVFSTLTGAGVVVVVSSCKQNVNVFLASRDKVIRSHWRRCGALYALVLGLNVDPEAEQELPMKSSTHAQIIEE